MSIIYINIYIINTLTIVTYWLFIVLVMTQKIVLKKKKSPQKESQKFLCVFFLLLQGGSEWMHHWQTQWLMLISSTRHLSPVPPWMNRNISFASPPVFQPACCSVVYNRSTGFHGNLFPRWSFVYIQRRGCYGNCVWFWRSLSPCSFQFSSISWDSKLTMSR